MLVKHKNLYVKDIFFEKYSIFFLETRNEISIFIQFFMSKKKCKKDGLLNN